MSDTKFKPNIRNFDSFNDVIKHHREDSGINPGKLADDINVHRNSQTNYERSRDPNMDYLVSFSYFTKAPFWHLVTERVRLGAAPEEHKESILKEAEKLLSRLAFSDQLDENHTATNSNENKGLADLSEQVCKEMSYALGGSESVQSLRYNSDSMQPTISPESSLLVDRRDHELTDGKIYAFNTVNGLIIRRIQILFTDDLLLIPDNKTYEPVKVKSGKKEQLDIIGRVIVGINHF